MAYWTVKCVSSGVPFPGNQCNTFLRLTEEKMTLSGVGGEEDPEEREDKKLKLRKIKDTFNMNSCLSLKVSTSSWFHYAISEGG